MASPMIEFNGVWKKFNKGEKFNSIRDAIPQLFSKKTDEGQLKTLEFWAVKNVSFKIPKGGVVGIMGPNGAGKSTILKLLSKIIVPTKGEMVINGRLSALIEVTAGFHPELTGRENVYLNGTILGMRRKEIDDKFDEIVEFSGVKEFIDTPVKRYSSGMFSRLGFSVAAHMDPEILLVDEVLAVGDISFQAKCAQKMRELLKSGATIVLVSHQLNMIQSLCDRVILLQHGEVIEDGPVEEVIPHYQNIVFKNAENELIKKIKNTQERVNVDSQSLVDITGVRTSPTLELGAPLKIDMEFKAREKIEGPVFTCEIIRSDGVICCATRSDFTGTQVDYIQNTGRCTIDMGPNQLNPGIYMVKLAIWDKSMIHPYVVRNQEVVRVQMDGRQSQMHAIFIPNIHWEIKKNI